MNYRYIYASLIAKRQRHPPVIGYTERHHIMPKCLGGSNDPSNLVVLTAREHFVAHALLAKIHPSNFKIIHAAWRMSNCRRYNARKYDWLRKKRAESLRGNTFTKGKKLTEEHKKKISNSLMGHPFYGSDYSAATIARRTAHFKGNKYRLGTRQSPETIAKIHAKRRCANCGFDVTPTCLARWHGDKCKKRAA